MRHFDSHAYRTEDEAGVWDFALGSMRMYLIFKEKVRQFNQDAEIQGLLRELEQRGGGRKHEPITRDGAKALKAEAFDMQPSRDRGYGYERLDQLTIELLLGVR